MTVNFPGEVLREVNEKLLIAGIEQQELAESACESRDRLAALINGVDAVVCEVSITTGDIRFLSDQAETFLDYPRATFSKRGFWRRVIHRADRALALATLYEAIRLRRVHEHEFRVVAANGRVIWVRNRAVVVEDASGAAVFLRCIIVDGTDRKHAELLQAEALEREQRINSYLQRPLQTHFAEDDFPNLRIAAWYEPALTEAEVGGDFFDVFTVGEPHAICCTVLCVGDVIGKGLPAASLAMRIKEMVYAFATENLDPADMLYRINNYLCRLAARGESGRGVHDGFESLMLAALIIGVVDSDAETLTVATGGAEPVAIIRAAGYCETITATGITLGVERNEPFKNAVVSIAPGDTVLLTSDGLTEARRGTDFLGYHGVTNLAVTHVQADTVTQMGHAIVRDARAYAGKFSDDVCLLVARYEKSAPLANSTMPIELVTDTARSYTGSVGI